LLWLALLAVLALIWLRAVIHLGLLEEAAEIEIGPPIICPHCGRLTPLHSFCGNCGTALRAYPKQVAKSAVTPAAPQSGGPSAPAARAPGPRRARRARPAPRPPPPAPAPPSRSRLAVLCARGDAAAGTGRFAGGEGLAEPAHRGLRDHPRRGDRHRRRHRVRTP